MIRIKFSEYIFISSTVIASIILFTGIVSAALSPTMENQSNESGSTFYFSRIYVDGFSVNSNGFKLLLRTTRQPFGFQPFLADIEFILMEGKKVIYTDTQRQISLREGSGELTSQFHIVLKEGQNYTALSRVYLYEDGSPRYYLTATSSFTAKSDVAITEVYGDGIGASATIKGKSMVPLNASITFTLSQKGQELETREVTVPAILSHDKDKTVNVLWDRKLDDGTYMVSVVLDGKDLQVKYDKVFTVEKKAVVPTPKSTEQLGKSVPGFTSFLAALAIIFLYIQRGLRRGS